MSIGVGGISLGGGSLTPHALSAKVAANAAAGVTTIARVLAGSTFGISSGATITPAGSISLTSGIAPGGTGSFTVTETLTSGVTLTYPLSLSADAIAPAAPTIAGITAGDGKLTFAVTDGAANGSPITGHKVYGSTTSGFTVGPATALGTFGAGSPVVVTGLTNGTKLYTRVAAVNGVGEGAASAETSATPSAGGPYLPAFSQAVSAAYAPIRLTAGTATPLIRAKRLADNAQQDFAASTGSDYVLASDLDAWAPNGYQLITAYDQKGTRNLTGAMTGAKDLTFAGVRGLTFGAADSASTPAGKSFNRQSFGVAMILYPRSSRPNAPHIITEFDDSSNGDPLFNLFLAASPGLYVRSGGSQNGTGVMLPTALQTLFILSTPSAFTIYLDGVAIVSLGALAAQALTGAGGIGLWPGYINSAGFDIFARMDFLEGAAPTTADVASFHAWAKARLPLVDVGGQTKQIVWALDSFGQGHKDLSNPAISIGLDPATWLSHNLSKFGRTLATAAGERSVNASVLRSGMTHKVLCIAAPTNDLLQAGNFASAADAQAWATNIYNNTLLPFVAGSKSDGFTHFIVQTTVLNGAWDTTSNYKQTAANYYAQLLRNGASANGYTVADLIADTRFATLNTTYYDPDLLHPADPAGYAATGDIWKQAAEAATGLTL